VFDGTGRKGGDKRLGFKKGSAWEKGTNSRKKDEKLKKGLYAFIRRPSSNLEKKLDIIEI